MDSGQYIQYIYSIYTLIVSYYLIFTKNTDHTYIMYSIMLQLVHVEWIVSPPLSAISCNHDGVMLTNAWWIYLLERFLIIIQPSTK